MAVLPNAYNTYADNAILTASKQELTLLLYEGALKFTNQAIVAMNDRNYEKSNELIGKVQNIIREFQITLDHKYEIAKSMNSLYSYMYRKLSEAMVKKDIACLEEVRDLLREFRDTWKEAMKLAKTSK